MRYEVMGKLTPRERVRLLVHNEPKWRAVLRECLLIAKEHKGQFAGAWVMQSLRFQKIAPPSNLRTLSTLGLLKLEKKTRSGNRAYYTIPHREEIAKGLTWRE